MIIKKHIVIYQRQVEDMIDIFSDNRNEILGNQEGPSDHLMDALRKTANGGHVILADDKEKIVGFLIGIDIHGSNLISIEYTAVSKEYRRQGVFTRMLSLLLKEGSELGLSCLPNLAQFYSKHGFDIKAHRGNFLIMVRPSLQCLPIEKTSTLNVGVDQLEHLGARNI